MVVYVIVVTHNAVNWLDVCFESLIDSSSDLKIIVVDNGSCDGTPYIIERKYPFVELIKLDTNIGFGKANNIGLVKAINSGADYVCLLNQDAALKPNTIESLITVFKSEPEYGILSPLQFHNDYQLDYLFENYLCKENTPDILNDFITGNLKRIYQTSFVNAAIWLISSKCIKKVGGFAPIFSMYGEDNNFIDRSIFYNFKTGIVPKAIGYHFRDQKVISVPFKRRLYMEYTASLVELMNPRQLYFKACKNILTRYLMRSEVKTFLINSLILIIIAIRLILVMHLIIKQKRMCMQESPFIGNNKKN